ncbi:ribonuclease HII [Nitzschia inconspicua]|uniref:Ribonuclease n=1 Tax=Nitzschia inconspicua TaxID=303405 RepID=A0A9K3L2V1_9STRA|nr:ribonuclease HII [Nitzschia inconspicua]
MGEPDSVSNLDHCYCQCRIAVHCNRCGKPVKDRDATKEAVGALCTQSRPRIANVFGNGPLFLSDIPESCSSNSSSEIVLGIDEAGRGSVLGPMVYGAAYWSADVENTKKSIPKDFNDSKQLTEKDRERLFKTILKNPDIGFVVRSLLPSEISRNMLREHPYNLNEMSHDSAITMIRKVLDQGVVVKRAYIDTVGHPQAYQRKLEREFPGIDFVVESKADAKYAPCSAASVVAKVMRDHVLEQWKFSEPLCGNYEELDKQLHDFGSGYPSDPKCKGWMENNPLCDKVFGYPDLVRFSWAPSKQRLEDTAVSVVFRADLDEEDEDLQQQQQGMASFLKKGTTRKRKRFGYFEDRNIRVSKLLTM